MDVAYNVRNKHEVRWLIQVQVQVEEIIYFQKNIRSSVSIQFYKIFIIHNALRQEGNFKRFNTLEISLFKTWIKIYIEAMKFRFQW